MCENQLLMGHVDRADGAQRFQQTKCGTESMFEWDEVGLQVRRGIYVT